MGRPIPIVRDCYYELKADSEGHISQASSLPLNLVEKQTVLDSHGCAQQVELSAQIHGMSSMSGEGDPKLTCYLRNTFRISGTATIPRGRSYVTTENFMVQVTSMVLVVSATKSIGGDLIKLKFVKLPEGIVGHDTKRAAVSRL